MAIESKNHRPSPVKEVMVSQGTRNDSHPASFTSKHETYAEEQTALLKEKADIEERMKAYSRAKFTEAQSRIRQRHEGVEKWLQLRSRMENERSALVSRKQAIELRFSELRPLLVREREAYGKPDIGHVTNRPLIFEGGEKTDHDVAIVRVIGLLEAISTSLSKLLDKLER